MTSGNVVQPGGGAVQGYGYSSRMGGPEPANLADILERVLDKGLVIAGDIRVNLLDIELLTIKLRLVIASVDTARQIGINWWETDPWLHAGGDGSGRRQLAEENRELRAHVAALERREAAEENRELRARITDLERGEAAGENRELRAPDADLERDADLEQGEAAEESHEPRARDAGLARDEAAGENRQLRARITDLEQDAGPGAGRGRGTGRGRGAS